MGDRLTLLLPRIGFGALVAAALLVPIAYVPVFADPFVLPKAVVSWVAVLLAVAGVAVDALASRRWPLGRVRILLPLALLVGWTALATVLSPVPLTSLMGAYGRYDGLAALLAGGAAALALAAYTAADPGRLASIAVALLAGGLVGVVVVALQGLGWALTGWTVPGLPDLDIIGLAGNPNFSGALLALAVPFALGLRSWSERRGVRIGLVAAAVVLGGGVLWTGTRGGIIALLGGTAAFAWLAPALLPKLVRWGATAAVAVVLAAVALSSVSDALPGTERTEAPSVLDTSGLGQRQYLWSGSARVVAAHPLIGAGPDALALRFPYERSTRGSGRLLIDADEAHDVYLDRAATAGLPALAGYLWLVGTVAFVAWRARRQVAEAHRWLLAAFGGAFVGYLLQGAFSIDMVPLAFVSWLCIGALTALTDPSAQTVPVPEGARAAARRPVPAAALAGIVLVVVLGTVAALRPLVADRHVRLGEREADAGRSLEAYGEFATASAWLGHEPSYHRRQAAALVTLAAAPSTDPELRRSLLDEALIAYDQALDRAPGDVPLLLAQADTHLLAAQAAASTEASESHIDDALAILRGLDSDLRADDALPLRIGRAYEARSRLDLPGSAQDRERAAAAYEQARPYKPDQVEALGALARLAVEDGHLHRAKQLLAFAHRLAPDDETVKAAADEVDRRLRNGN